MMLVHLVFVFASYADDVCAPGFRVTPVKTHAVPNGISYFIRSVPGTREVSFGSLDQNTKSKVLNVDTGRTTDVEGDVDPVLTPDGALLTIPTGYYFNGKTGKTVLAAKNEEAKPKYVFLEGAMHEVDHFEKTVDLTKDEARRRGIDFAYPAMVFFARDGKGGFKPVYSDENSNVTYQSMGVLSDHANEKRYRMLFKDQQVSYQDYVYDASKQSVEPLGSRRAVCAQAADGDLPMLAKDGRSFTSYDEQAQVSRVYEMDERGGCQARDTLPSMTGKVDFSPDGKLLAFQLDEGAAPGTTGSREFERPTSEQRLRAFVYDRESKRLTAVSNEASGHTYFPVFLSNDEIAYAHADSDTNVKAMEIKVVKLSRNEAPPTSCPTCASTPKLRQASALLAKLYADRCNPLGFDFADADRTLAWLTPQTCGGFVDGLSPGQVTAAKAAGGIKPKTWRADVLKTVSKADLSDVCRRLKVPVLGDASGANADH